MNEFILVEFLASGTAELELLRSKVDALGADYQQMIEESGYDHYLWYKLFGRINSVRASLIKLQDPFLSERMKISYISETLKDKYRT